LNDRTDPLALAQAKADIRALVERDFNRKSTRGRKRHARFLEDYSKPPWNEATAGTKFSSAPDGHANPSGLP